MVKLKHYFLGGITFLGTILVGLLAFSYTNLDHGISGQTITADIWNQLIDKVNEVGNNQNFYGFSAYQSTAQTLAAVTRTKINFQTEEYDSSNQYNNTNSRFQPTKAGYYQVNGAICLNISSTNIQPRIYKNGSIFKRGTNALQGNTGIISSLVYLNGTTDYIELWGALSTSATTAI